MKVTKNIILIILILVLGGLFIFRDSIITQPAPEIPTEHIGAAIPAPVELPAETPAVQTPPPVVNPGPTKDQQYYFHTLVTTNVSKELTELVGSENIQALLQTNRVDLKHIKQGSKIVIPVSFDNDSRSPFPTIVDSLSEVPKILLFSQRVQAFAAYEYGVLVRWGGISSGKQSTKTPNGLFSTNWKGKEVKSTFDDEWILKYNFNIENFEGIGFHQYEMPGYPASHSCLRLLLEDAMWLYDWAEQWVLAPDGNTRLAHGTPVIVFGDYGFGKTAPWKLLPTDAEATTISQSEVTALIQKHSAVIIERQRERKAVLGQ